MSAVSLINAHSLIARVSVLHWNRPADCLRTIGALKKQTLPLQITVVDNGSSTDNLQHLKENLPSDVELWPLGENQGWGRAHNKVIQRWLDHEQSEWCLICAHDALPAPDCVSRLVSAMQMHPLWGMCCPEYGKPEIPKFSLLRGIRVEDAHVNPSDDYTEVEFSHGTLSVLRRQCISQIGTFDEEFFVYGDEIEIALRARSKGWKIGLVWGALLTNPGTASSGPVLAYIFARNGLLLAQRVAGGAGVTIRLCVMLFSLLKDFALRVSQTSSRSPVARWYGIQDYFRGDRSAPPSKVLSFTKK